MKTQYKDLLDKYPDTVNKEQLCEICHIGKATAKYYLDTGLIPCVHNGRRTRCYTITMKDVVAFLGDREANPDRYKLPKQAPSRAAQPTLPPLPKGYTGKPLNYYREHYASLPDLLIVDEAARMVYVGRDAVLRWCREGRFPVVKAGRKWLVGKEGDLGFLVWYTKRHGATN